MMGEPRWKKFLLTELLKWINSRALTIIEPFSNENSGATTATATTVAAEIIITETATKNKKTI